MKSPYIAIPPGPTAAERRERDALALVADFDDADLATLAAEVIRREQRQWWRKQWMGKDPRNHRTLALAIYGLFHETENP